MSLMSCQSSLPLLHRALWSVSFGRCAGPLSFALHETFLFCYRFRALAKLCRTGCG